MSFLSFLFLCIVSRENVPISLQTARQVWFWRFRSPHNEIVRERLARQSVAQAAVTKLNKERAAVMSEAKSQLGLWSDAGIEESRETFWC